MGFDQITPDELARRTKEWEDALTHSLSFSDKLMSAELALWSALLTIAALLVSIAAILITFVTPPMQPVVILSVLCSASSVVLIYKNLDRRRAVFRTLMSIPPKECTTRRELWDEYLLNLENKNRQHSAEEKDNRKREKLALALMVVGSLLSAIAVNIKAIP